MPAFVAASAMMWCVAATTAEPGFRRLSAAGIRTAVVGKTVTDDAHWTDRFMPDGILDSHELGESRRGTWTIERGELCIIRKAKRPLKECFEIWTKSDQVDYRRDGVSVMSGVLRDPTQ